MALGCSRSLLEFRSLRPIIAFVLLVACAAHAQSTGQWSSPQTLPYIPVHTTLLPSGKLLFFSYYSDSLYPQVWDPATNTVTATSVAPFELFCSGHTLMADGRMFIAGGHIADYTGYREALIYDPGANSFIGVPDMNAGRWYPTNTLLPNGDVLVVSGDMTSNTSPNPLPQVYQVSTNSWRDLTTAQLQMPLYPVMFVAPNGKVFNAGPSRTTRYLDPSGTGLWSVVGNMQFAGTRDYGPAVMYEPGKILAIGGSDPATNTAETINLNSSTPAWTYTGAMKYARRQHNAVILPDGKVFVVGGSSGAGFDNASTPVYPTEMWDPATGLWTAMASISVYRGYHSTALLLPDGRVFSGGGNIGGPNFQLFSPPYLFAGARPSISSAPNAVRYGQTVTIGTPDAASVAKVTLLALGSTTHTLDQNQRFAKLNFTQTAGGLNVTFPSSATTAPPGYYMLFVLNGAGVPSVAKIMQITASDPTTGTVTGEVTNSSGALLSGATVTAGGSTATTFSNGTYNLSSVPAGTATLSASLAGYQGASAFVTVASAAQTSAPVLVLTPINPGVITGAVNNSAGNAVPGATITGAGQSTTTDSQGNYSLVNVPAGDLTLTGSATGYSQALVQMTVVAGTTTTAPLITLVANFGSVSGTVRNASGVPVVGASVSYGGGSTTTNSSGVFTFAKVPVGTIQLVVSANGYTSQTQNVAIAGGSTTTANFTLSASSGTVSGRITNVSTGAVISGATVKWSGGSTLTNSTGNYTLANMATGSQGITATANGYLSRTLTASVAGGTTTTVNIPLATAGKTTVRVTSSTGVAISAATVTLKGGVIATNVSGTTNTSGYYYSPWVPIGSYTVTVSKTGRTTQTKSATVSTGATTTVTFSSF